MNSIWPGSSWQCKYGTFSKSLNCCGCGSSTSTCAEQPRILQHQGRSRPVVFLVALLVYQVLGSNVLQYIIVM